MDNEEKINILNETIINLETELFLANGKIEKLQESEYLLEEKILSLKDKELNKKIINPSDYV